MASTGEGLSGRIEKFADIRSVLFSALAGSIVLLSLPDSFVHTVYFWTGHRNGFCDYHLE